jgi:hypothetical protein
MRHVVEESDKILSMASLTLISDPASNALVLWRDVKHVAVVTNRDLTYASSRASIAGRFSNARAIASLCR